MVGLVYTMVDGGYDFLSQVKSEEQRGIGDENSQIMRQQETKHDPWEMGMGLLCIGEMLDVLDPICEIIL
jgi:hypothetical protein